ncbi:unnamed protein product [Allacma fusca]|uniref:AAA+ ATPase domain-containing protein n=1 Tax=Allacma fusca TaxID=39272 RepID=A0A8J2KY40_9HEXA|nr:unnamed protein product [Allacma fusca]
MADTNAFDYHIYYPANIIVSGVSQAGKSQLVAQLLRRRYEVMSPVPNNTIYCYGEKQSKLFDDLKKDLKLNGKGQLQDVRLDFVKGLDFDIPEENDTPTILVLDDLMDSVSKNKTLVDLFTRGSHHRSICVFLLVQNFFFPNMQTIKLNCKYLILMKNPRDNSIINFIGRQMNASAGEAETSGSDDNFDDDKAEHDIIEYPCRRPQCYLCDKSVCECDFGFKWRPRSLEDSDSAMCLLEERIIYLERIAEDQCAGSKRIAEDVEAHTFLLKQMQHKIGWRCGYAVSVRDELVPEKQQDRRSVWIGNMLRQIGILIRGRYSGVDLSISNIDIGGQDMKKIFVIRFPFNLPVCYILRGFGSMRPFVRVDEINPYLDDQGLTEYFSIYSKICTGDTCE